MNPTTNPYSTQAVSAPINHDMDVTTQINQYKEEEKTHKAPKVLPFSFDSTQEILSQMYENLLTFRKVVNGAEKEARINKGVLNEITKIVDSIGEQILVKLPEQLDKLGL